MGLKAVAEVEKEIRDWTDCYWPDDPDDSDLYLYHPGDSDNDPDEE